MHINICMYSAVFVIRHSICFIYTLTLYIYIPYTTHTHIHYTYTLYIYTTGHIRTFLGYGSFEGSVSPHSIDDLDLDNDTEVNNNDNNSNKNDSIISRCGSARDNGTKGQRQNENNNILFSFPIYSNPNTPRPTTSFIAYRGGGGSSIDGGSGSQLSARRGYSALMSSSNMYTTGSSGGGGSGGGGGTGGVTDGGTGGGMTGGGERAPLMPLFETKRYDSYAPSPV